MSLARWRYLSIFFFWSSTGRSKQSHQRGWILWCGRSCSWQTGQNRRTGEQKIRHSTRVQEMCSEVMLMLFVCVQSQTEKTRIQRSSPVPPGDVYSTVGSHRFTDKVVKLTALKLNNIIYQFHPFLLFLISHIIFFTSHLLLSHSSIFLFSIYHPSHFPHSLVISLSLCR